MYEKLLILNRFSAHFFCISRSEVARFWVGGGAILGWRWRDFRLVVARCTASIFRFSICIFSLFGLHFFAKSQSRADKKQMRGPLRPRIFQQNSSRAKFVTRIKTSPAKLLRSFARRKLLRPLRSQKTPSPPLRPLRSPTRRMGCSPREISQDRPDAPTHG